MTRELQIAVERAAQAAQTDPLVEALEALRDLVARCDGEQGVREDGSNIDTTKQHAILAKYAPDSEGGAE